MEQINNTAKDKLEFVSSIVTNSKGNVLLLKRNDKLKLDPGKYDLCSGHMKCGEVPMQSAIREINEELGIKLEEIKIMEKWGDIPTPHEKFKDTTTHIYKIEVALTSDEINNRIKNIEQPEITRVEYLENIGVLQRIYQETDCMRGKYNEKIDTILENIKIEYNKRKELDRCEEIIK